MKMTPLSYATLFSGGMIALLPNLGSQTSAIVAAFIIISLLYHAKRQA